MVDINNIKLPYVIKDKILMSPGIWNNFYYSAEEIRKSFHNTNWKSKETRSLFLDHIDTSSKEWVGEIQNPHLEGDTVKADLVFVDRPTAIKLAYGAKMGISPKVTGQTEDGENIMSDFVYDNFSVVINPAVKTAWINNQDMAAFEKIRKEKGLTPDEFYAIPLDPPSNSKLPIYDAAHVRNALARINQVKGVSEEQKTKAMEKIKAAAKKFNIKIDGEPTEEMNMNSEEDSKSATMEEVDQDLMDYTDFVKKSRKENPDWSFEKIAEEYKKQKENAQSELKANKLLELAEQFINLAEELKVMRTQAKEETKDDSKEDESEEPETEDKKDVEENASDDKEEESDKEDDEENKDDKETTQNQDETEEKEVESEVESLKEKNEELRQEIESLKKTNTQTMSQLTSQLEELKKKLDEPDKLSVKTVSMSSNNSEPKFTEGSEDASFLNTLKEDLRGR